VYRSTIFDLSDVPQGETPSLLIVGGVVAFADDESLACDCSGGQWLEKLLPSVTELNAQMVEEERG
jgi:hypothetical protein